MMYVLSFIAWPLIIGSHYYWWRRSRAVLAAERRLIPSAPAQRRGTQLRRLGVGLIVLFGWFQVFYAGPSLATWYHETGEHEVARELLGAYSLLPAFGALFLLSFWVEPLIDRGRAALRRFGERAGKEAGDCPGTPRCRGPAGAPGPCWS